MLIVPTDTLLDHLVRPTMAVVLLALLTGCPQETAPPDGDGPGTVIIGDGVTAALLAPATSFGISVLEDPISVFYSVTGATGQTDVSGYYVPLADADPNGSAIGDRVILETRDLDGDTDFFSFDPGAAGTGFYRFGILVSVDGVELDPVEGTAVAEVQGPPEPTFVLPEQAVTTIVPGDEVLITFDAGDPENRVQWRLFLLGENDSRADPADELGMELATGTGNTGLYILSTVDLAIAGYEIGISATDTGKSIAATVSAGFGDRIVTIPNNTAGGRIIQVVETLD